MNNGGFETLPLPRKEFAPSAVNAYRVYKDADNFVVIPAHTALEAVQNSKLEAVYKIERDLINFNKVMDPSAWPKTPDAAAATEATPSVADVATPPPPVDAAAAAPPTP